MTTRYKSERIEGNDKTTSVQTALATSIPSVIVSGMELFAATFGVAYGPWCHHQYADGYFRAAGTLAPL